MALSHIKNILFRKIGGKEQATMPCKVEMGDVFKFVFSVIVTLKIDIFRLYYVKRKAKKVCKCEFVCVFLSI